MGTDKADEIQIDYLTDFSSFAPLGYGFMDTVDWDPVNDGTGVSSNSTFRACGTNAGLIALAAYGDAKFMEKLILRSMLAYAAPSEDDVAMLDSLVLINLGIEYQIFDSLSIFVAGNYAVGDPKASGAPDDPAMALAGSVRLNF